MENSGVDGVPEGMVVVDAAAAPAHAFGHAPFMGTFPLKLEATGRIALPAALKGAFDGRAVLRPHRDQRLDLYTPLGFDAVVAEFARQQPNGLLDPRTRKRMHMAVTEVSVDKQGRFVVPPDLKARFALQERIVLAGAIEAIEVWPADAFEAERARFDEADLFFDGFEGL